MITEIPQKDIMDITFRLKAISSLFNKMIPVPSDDFNFDEEGKIFITDNLYKIIDQLEKYELPTGHHHENL